MDPRLLDHYEEELTYLREAAREFAEEHPDVAPRLGLDAPEIKDPYVERLLEGSAFLAARVQLKIDEEFPRFVQNMLDVTAPHLLAPTPSMCVVALEPNTTDPGLAKGVTIPAKAGLRGSIPDGDGPDCDFRTGRPVTLWPVALVEAEYILSRPTLARYAEAAGVRDYASGIRLRLQSGEPSPLANVEMDELDVYLSDETGGAGDLAKRLFEIFAGRCLGGAAQSPDAPPSQRPVKVGKPFASAFDSDESLLPGSPRVFPGYRMLHEYFACPERFQFVRLPGLLEALKASPGHRIDIVYLFTRDEGRLIETVDAGNFRLFATPAVNAFEKHIDPVSLEVDTPEHRIVVDRTQPYAYEFLAPVDGYVWRDDNNDRTRAYPIYDVAAGFSEWGQTPYYATRKVALRPSPTFRKRHGLSDYVGTDTMVSLVRPYPESARERALRVAGRGPAPWRFIGFRAIVSNRDYPLKLRFGTGPFDLELLEPGPVTGVRMVRRPTRPRSPMNFLGDPPDADRRTRGEWTWRAINHLSPNHFSLIDPEGGRPNGLREHLALYAFLDESAARAAVDSVHAVSATPIVRRIWTGGQQIVARGQRVDLEIDVTRFGGAGAYLFASVLARFLAEFATVNTFIETRARSSSGAELGVWPAFQGHRATL